MMTRVLPPLLLALLLALQPGALAQSNTTTSNTTVSGTGLLLRVRINGVYVNFTNCTLTELGALHCDSDLQHDVTVTRAETTGTEAWVVALIVVLFVLLVIVAGVAIGSYFYKRGQAGGAYQPVPYPPDPAGYSQPGYPQPGYPQPGYSQPSYSVYSAAQKRVIEVDLVRPQNFI